MINSIEDLRSAGVLPTGPVSAWPESRNVAGPGMREQTPAVAPVEHDKRVRASAGQMARNAAKSARQALGGRVTEEIRNERLDICKSCKHFIERSSRCSECGCFMPIKSGINADPKELCPKKKWLR